MILDPACGSKMFWFDKDSAGVVFGDLRRESHTLCDGRELHIRPDVQMSYTALPFACGQFAMVVFDPPHLINVGNNSWMAKKYGQLKKGWPDEIAAGFAECFRVLQPGGTLIFKWNEDQVPVSEVIKLAGVRPLFGHKSGRNSKTHWLCFMKVKP
jgi:SAM-dependent methyltransferase